MEGEEKHAQTAIIHTARSIAIAAVLFVLGCLILFSTFFWQGDTPRAAASVQQTAVAAPQLPISTSGPSKASKPPIAAAELWKAPDEATIPSGPAGELIRYGRDVIAHTSKYFGPNGSIAKISNGMNCQNCHLDGGRKLFGNNYSVFYSSYPKKGARSGKIDQPVDRIADCFKRSLAGKMPDPSGKEVQAMLAYLKWIGSGVKKKQKVFGTATEKLKFLDRPADPKRGLVVYNRKCKSCHGADGSGQLLPDKTGYVYPPLWGPHSYNDGAGMTRISNFAGFVKNNMPFGASYENPQLSDEEAWDVAAFVNSQLRGHLDSRNDYRDLSVKPIDAPFGPYADGFSEKQHKFGPYGPIVAVARGKKGE